MYDWQVYEERQISSAVVSITQSSGSWSGDSMNTVTQDISTEYFDEQEYRLTSWSGMASANWHLDAIFFIKSVQLRVSSSSPQFELHVVNSVDVLSSECT